MAKTKKRDLLIDADKMLRRLSCTMGLRIIASPDNDAVDRFLDLGDGEVWLGRTPDEDSHFRIAGANVWIHDSAISQAHLHIDCRGRTSEAWIEDKGSSNGTWVNGQRTAKAHLKGQEVIRIGDSLLVYCPRTPEPATDPQEMGMVGRSAALHAVRQAIMECASSDLVALVTGESGCGKELVAEAIHTTSGRQGPLLPVNLNATTETLVDSQLFGHVRGAFSGATADRKGYFETATDGTLFLDEIGEISTAIQVKLLRAIDRKEVIRMGEATPRKCNARVVAATNRDLQAAVDDNNFRSDLFFRLNQHAIEVPPLRTRREDIPVLWTHFLKKTAQQRLNADADLMEALLIYPWPGNVRELKSLAERFKTRLVAGESLSIHDLPQKIQDHLLAARRGRGDQLVSPELSANVAEPGQKDATPADHRVLPPRARPTPEALRDALARHRGNIAAVGREMGRKREQIHRWVQTFGINIDAYRDQKPPPPSELN